MAADQDKNQYFSIILWPPGLVAFTTLRTLPGKMKPLCMYVKRCVFKTGLEVSKMVPKQVIKAVIKASAFLSYQSHLAFKLSSYNWSQNEVLLLIY